jgi:1,4-alpha-glucan branching enzyme
MGKRESLTKIDKDDSKGWFAQKRSTLAAALVFTAPGIPMMFQGQEFLEGEWFRDSVPLDWDQRDEFRGIVRMHRDLITLRLNRQGWSRGLCGHHVQVHHVNDERKIVAFRRWDQGGAADDVVVVANFLHEAQTDDVVGFPAEGSWRLRFNSDSRGYSERFQGHESGDVRVDPGEYDGLPFHGRISVAPYSVLIFSQDPK